MDYITTIGIEVHAELKTASKMFCGCRNDPDEKRPNINICPVCTAQPGALPTINKEAVRQMIRIGYAVGGAVADFTEFDRKNYFYPDLPKGFQISQYKLPIVSGGMLHGVQLTRIHLEEDTARSQHSATGESSLIDYNRSSVPLMELVTEPVVHSAKDAADFARELQLLLRYLGASEANMEKGQMRVEANISVSKDPKVFGTKVEVKNLNSFRSVERAVEYEVARQIDLLETGGTVVQETRGWNEAKQATYSQRTKENSHDYRYFPEPDLPKLYLSKIPEFEDLKDTLPELPWAKRERLKQSYGLSDTITEVFVQNIELGIFFEHTLKDGADAKLAANYLTSDLISLIKLKAGSDVSDFDTYLKEMPLTASDFSLLVKMIQAGELSSRGAKDILAELYEKGGNPRVIATARGLMQKSDTEALSKIVDQVIRENTQVSEEFKAGKEASLQFLVGQGMKLSKGSANPTVLKELFIAKLK